MRYREILNEFIIKLGPATVHRNPIKPIVHNLINKSAYSELRGLITGDKIYLWDSSLGTHGGVFSSLNLDGFIEEKAYSSFYLQKGINGLAYTNFHNYGVDPLRDPGESWPIRLYNQERLAYGQINILNKHLQGWNS